MITKVVILFILMLLFVVSDAMQDAITWNFDQSVFRNLNPLYFDPSQSWVNKYKDNNPLEGEKFFGSTTFFVWLTDFWHMLKFIKMNCIWVALSVGTCLWWLYFVGMVFHGVVFELAYRIIRRIKK